MNEDLETMALNIEKMVGEFDACCSLCGKLTDKPLHTHEIDLNHDNHDPDNQIEICEECHQKLTPAIKQRKTPPTDECVADSDFWKVDYDEGPATMKVRKRAYPAFKEFLLGYLLSHSIITRDKAVKDGMNVARCSGQVIKYEYLERLTADNGPLEMNSDGIIRFRASWLDENPLVKEAREQRLGPMAKAGILVPLSDVEGGS